MWSFEGLYPQAMLTAQLAIDALLVVLVAALLWRQGRAGRKAAQASEGAMAATENLLRRLEEKRRTLEGAMEAVRAKEPLVAPHRPEPAVQRGPVQREPAQRQPVPREPAPSRPGLERARLLAARGLTSAEIARKLGVPRGEVEMYLALRQEG